MLSRTDKVVRESTRRRKQLGLSQADAARLAGVVPSYLGQVELGLRPPSRRLLESLEVIYRVRRRRYTDMMSFPGPGRKKMDVSLRTALNSLSNGVSRRLGALPTAVEVRSSNTSRPEPTPIHDLLWPMAIHLGPEAQREVERLEILRRDDEEFWRLFNRIRFDSWSEKRFMVRVGLAGGHLVNVSSRSLGVDLHVLHPRTGRVDSHTPHPAMILHHGGLNVAFVPQCSVLAQNHIRRLDALVIITDGQRRVVVNLELDGPHHNPARDRRRQSSIGLPTLRIPVAALDETRLIDRVFEALRWSLDHCR